jgi:hypothetical protein
MKQGLPESRCTHYRPLQRAARLAFVLVGLLAVAAPSSAAAQDSALVMIADTGGVAPEEARAAFAVLLAELRARHPASDLRGDVTRAPAETFAACELSRCRASLMLRWHAFSVVLVRFVAAGAQPVTAPRVVVDVYDASGQRAGQAAVDLVAGDTGSYAEALRAGLASLTLPRPTFASLLVTCDVDAARVFVDDRPLGVVPLGALRVAPGRHRLRVLAPGYLPHEQTIDVPPAGARVDLRLQREGGS